ncbi:hypothetical protein B5G38_02130 [Gemmiger sp. An87]|nr:hypothetical protein B5G38_02130 [Gemmiger sp. An87]
MVIIADKPLLLKRFFPAGADGAALGKRKPFAGSRAENAAPAKGVNQEAGAATLFFSSGRARAPGGISYRLRPSS